MFCVQELADQGVGHPDFGLYANRPDVEREAAGWVEPEHGLVRSTIARTRWGINKAAGAGGWMPKSGSPMRCGGSSQRRWPAHQFRAGSATRPCTTECR